MVQENIDPTPITNPGDTKQKYTIAVIAIVAIFAITLLLFFAGSEVGQAIQFKSVLQVGEAGVLIEDGSIEKVGTVVKVPVKANLGDGKSTAFSFDLESKNGLDLRCQDLVRKDDDFFSNNGFSVIKDVNCDDLGNKVHVEYFWLCDGSDDECNLITGTVDLFEISVVADSIGAKGLEISNFQILDLDGNNLVNPEFIKRTVELNFAQCLENSDCDKSGIACIQNVCQKDSDSDGLLDANDNCPLVKNGNQLDSNKDGKGDACTVSVCSKENFAACNNVEECKNAKGVIVNDECVDDKDEDGVPSELDNCPEVKNAGSILTLTEGQSKSLVIDQRKFDVKVLKITDTEKIVSIDGNRFNLNNKRDINLEDGTSIILKSAQGVDFVYTGSSSGGGSGGSSSGDYLHSADKKCVADWVCEDWSVCDGNLKSRTCQDKNGCSVKKVQQSLCSVDQPQDTTKNILTGKATFVPASGSITTDSSEGSSVASKTSSANVVEGSDLYESTVDFSKTASEGILSDNSEVEGEKDIFNFESKKSTGSIANEAKADESVKSLTLIIGSQLDSDGDGKGDACRGAQVVSSCGDGVVSKSETCLTCPQDAACAKGLTCDITGRCLDKADAKQAATPKVGIPKSDVCRPNNLAKCNKGDCEAVGASFNLVCKAPRNYAGGTNFYVKDLAPNEGNYGLDLVAINEINKPFQVYVTFMDEDDKILHFEFRNIAKLNKGQALKLNTQVIGTVAKKRVIVADTLDPSKWEVYLSAPLEVEY